MTVFNERELRRHEYLALALLMVALVLGAAAIWLRARQVWIPEYPHTMLGLAVVMLYTSLVWRHLVFFSIRQQGISGARGFHRMILYLALYSLCVICGVTWLLYERQRLPTIAWMRDRTVSVILLYAMLAMFLPWALTFAAQTLLKKRPPHRNPDASEI